MFARFYEPASGRFISQDSKMQGGNWFSYCRNNPVNFIDESGQAYFVDFMMFIFAALLLGAAVTLGWWAIIIGAFIALLIGSIVYTILDTWKTGSEAKELLLGAPWHGEDMILSMINEIKTDGSPMQKLGAEMAETEVYLIDALDS